MYIPILSELIQSMFSESEYWENIQKAKLEKEVEELLGE